jgi:hypothetical protein
MPITLTFTPEQFERLLKLAYVGEFTANVDVPDAEMDDERRALADLRSRLFAEASEQGAGHLAYRDDTGGEWFASRALEEDEDIKRYIREYDDHVFHEELVHRLASRDLMREYGADTLRHMEDAHYARAQKALLEYYDAELDAHGVDRIEIKES